MKVRKNPERLFERPKKPPNDRTTTFSGQNRESGIGIFLRFFLVSDWFLQCPSSCTAQKSDKSRVASEKSAAKKVEIGDRSWSKTRSDEPPQRAVSVATADCRVVVEMSRTAPRASQRPHRRPRLHCHLPPSVSTQRRRRCLQLSR